MFVMIQFCLQGKDLGRVIAGLKSVPPHQYFEFHATLRHWLAQQFQSKLRRNAFKAGFYPAKISSRDKRQKIQN